MKKWIAIDKASGALKQFALGVVVIAAVVFGPGGAANAAINYDFSTGLQGWTQIYPTTGDLWAADFGWPAGTGSKGHLGAGWENADTQMGRSPAFALNGSGNLTFQLFGSASPLAAPDVAPSAIPETATINGGFIGVALRDAAADTYVLSKGLSADQYEAFATLSCTAVELQPYTNNGKFYTLDFIDYDKYGGPTGGDGWGWLVSASIPGLLAASTACDITAFGPGAVINQDAKTITWHVPFGTTPEQVAALAPTYTLSARATCNQTNGAVPTPPLSTTGSVTYKVTAEDAITTKEYAVTVIVLPFESTLIWSAAGGGAWDTNTPNWLGQASGLPMLFSDGLAVIFDNPAGGTSAGAGT